MAAPLVLRPLNDTEAHDLHALAHGRKVEARLRARTRICWLAHQGQRVREISHALGIGQPTVRRWIHRFTTDGLAAFT